MSDKAFLNTRELVLCALFAALIAVGAFIRIPFPYVPITLQTLFTNLAGLLLGRKLGSVSVGVYILLGLAGAPVFAMGGGPGCVLQPSFGYIIGYLAGTYAAGRVTDGVKHVSFKRALAAGVINMCIVYLFGTVYFYLVANYYLGGASSIGAQSLMWYGVIIFIPGDVLKCLASAALLGKLRSVWTDFRI